MCIDISIEPDFSVFWVYGICYCTTHTASHPRRP